MVYGVVTEVAAPIQAYDTVHAALLARKDFGDLGLLVHVGQPTGTGFRVIEVWESKERFDRFNTEVLPAVLAEVSAASAPPADGMPAPSVEQFEVRGLVLPTAGTAW